MPEGGQGGGAGNGAQGDRSAGGGEGDRQSRRGPQIKRRKRHYEQPTELVDQLIHRYGSRDRAIEELARQTYDLREDRREAEEEIEQLKTQVAPKDAVILTGPKAEAWKKIDALATELKLPEATMGDKIVERVKKADTLETEKTKTDLSTKRKAVATAAGVNGDVLDPLLDQFGLEVETKEIQVQGTDGKLTPKQVAHVRKAGDANAAWEKLSDFVARDGSPLKPFAAALATKAATTGAAGNNTGGAIPFPEQQGGGSSGGKTSVADEFLKRNKERADRPNPLRAPTQTTKSDAA